MDVWMRREARDWKEGERGEGTKGKKDEEIAV